MKLLNSAIFASALLSAKDVNVLGEKSDDADFSDMTDLVDDNGAMVAKLYYRLDAYDEAMLPEGAVTDADGVNAITMKMVYEGDAWLSVGLSPQSSMVGSEVVIGVAGDATTPAKYGPISSKNGNGVVSTEVDNAGQTLMDATVEQANGQTTLTFTKALAEAGETAYDANGQNTMTFAVGGDNTFPSYHSGGRSIFSLDLASVARPASGSGLTDGTGTNTTVEDNGGGNGTVANITIEDNGGGTGALEGATNPSAGVSLGQNQGMVAVLGACTFAVVSALF